MIAALANGGALLGEAAWIAMAARAFAFIAADMTRGDRLGHSWRDGRLLFPGLASDFACMIRAALALHEATGERAYLDQALAWQRALDRHYANPDNGGYFLTADDAEGLVVRPAATSDDATPNPNAVAAGNLVRLAVLAGDDAWRDKADRLIEGVLGAAGENLIGHAALLNALDLRLRGAEIVVTGRASGADALMAAARKLPFLDRIVLRAPDADALPASHPARDKIAAAPDGAAFVCVGERCSLPVTTAERTDCRGPRDDGAASSRSKLESLPGTRGSPKLTQILEDAHARLALALLFTVHGSRAGARAGRRACRAQHHGERRQPLPHDLRDREQGTQAVDSLKLDFALFNTEGAVYRRMLTDMGPVRSGQDRGEDLRDRRRLRTTRLAAGERSYRLRARRTERVSRGPCPVVAREGGSLSTNILA